MEIIKFWWAVKDIYPNTFYWSCTILLPFVSLYNCEVGFSAIKTKLRSKLQLLSNALRLKLTNIDVDINWVVEKYRKRVHCKLYIKCSWIILKKKIIVDVFHIRWYSLLLVIQSIRSSLNKKMKKKLKLYNWNYILICNWFLDYRRWLL